MNTSSALLSSPKCLAVICKSSCSSFPVQDALCSCWAPPLHTAQGVTTRCPSCDQCYASAFPPGLPFPKLSASAASTRLLQAFTPILCTPFCIPVRIQQTPTHPNPPVLPPVAILVLVTSHRRLHLHADVY